MARGVTLEQLLYNLRTEIGQSTNPAISRSTRSRFISIMNRIQRRLYYDFEWPFRDIHRDIKMEAGARYYDFPTEIDMDRTVRLEAKDGGYWKKVGFGIKNTHLNQYDSDADVRSDPVWRWDFYLQDDNPNPMIEAWPVPATDGDETTLERYLRVHGQRKLVDMVNDSDVCTVDGDLIVGYAAAEILAKMRTGDAQAKLENANSLYLRLKGRSTPSEPFTVGGDTFNEGPEYRQRELRGGTYRQEE